MSLRWPDQNVHKSSNWMQYIFKPIYRSNLVYVLVPFLILLLFALSQAGTSLFILSRFGFSHMAALFLASMICICLTCVYFQKISAGFNRRFYLSIDHYKASRDLAKSFKSLDQNTKKFENVQVMWILMRYQHIVKKLRTLESMGMHNIYMWICNELKSDSALLGDNDFYSSLQDHSKMMTWMCKVIEFENLLKKIRLDQSKYKIYKIRSLCTLYSWACLENVGQDKKNKIISMFKSSFIFTDAYSDDLKNILDSIEEKERFFKEAVGYNNLSEGWYKKQLKYYRITLDHKLNPDPDSYWLPGWISRLGGYGNMIFGNNLLGLYGSVAGVAALISFYPIIHLSLTIKALIAVFGCCSAAFASYTLTWPILHKLLIYFSRWKFRAKARRIFRQKCQWIKAAPVNIRLVLAIGLASIVTFAAVHFNMYATWHLVNRLIALFGSTGFGHYLAHIPWLFKVSITILQGCCSLLCAGGLYFFSCYNQYVGKDGKVSLRYISVIDKIQGYIKDRSWLKVLLLVVIVSSSLLAAFAQTIIWFQGFSVIAASMVAVPAVMAFFATYCEAGLICLDGANKSSWPSQEMVVAWQNEYSEHGSEDNGLKTPTSYDADDGNVGLPLREGVDDDVGLELTP